MKKESMRMKKDIRAYEYEELQKELERLEKEKQKLQSEIERVSKKLNNKKFLANAKEDVVQEERAKGEKYQSMLDAVLERIGALS